MAYFTDGKPVQGKSEIEYLWHKLRWRFASEVHRNLFAKEPDRYTPQYDGYCAMGVSAGGEGHKDTVDPEAWAIVHGKLYLTHMSQAMDDWRQNPADIITGKPASHGAQVRSARVVVRAIGGIAKITVATSPASGPKPKNTRMGTR